MSLYGDSWSLDNVHEEESQFKDLLKPADESLSIKTTTTLPRPQPHTTITTNLPTTAHPSVIIPTVQKPSTGQPVVESPTKSNESMENGTLKQQLTEKGLQKTMPADLSVLVMFSKTSEITHDKQESARKNYISQISKMLYYCSDYINKNNRQLNHWSELLIDIKPFIEFQNK